MKFFNYFLLVSAFALVPVSCDNKAENLWQIEIKNPAQKVEVQDLSAEFYDPNVPLAKFQQKYPWFQGTVSDEDFGKRRLDTTEISIYKEAAAKIDTQKLNGELTTLFSHIQYYFPEFKQPKVFLYSSALQGIMEPIFYHDAENMLFIDISAFLGLNNPNYKGLEQYWQVSMNPQNIVPKVSRVFAGFFMKESFEHQKFIDELIYHGKIMTLQDAFLPGFPDYLKINYDQKQYEWADANEANVWNYFVENNLVFSDDTRLRERFINPGPFSKFYTEVDNDSSPQIGIFTGWQIARKFFEAKPETKLTDFLEMDSQTIFNESNYKPKN